MTAVIAYDLPVKNLIDELSATGHVTHTKYRKDMVTIHHNGGRLSHEGVLNVWKTRPASAHFDVDGYGAVAQYVAANEYAWATGTTEGNQRSISIEMANATLGPDWVVADATWRSAARLAGWIFAKIIGTRPNLSNLVVHHHWKATTCAGPMIDRILSQIVDLAAEYYDSFVWSSQQPLPSPSGKSVDQLADEVLRGLWGNGAQREALLEAAGYDYHAVQTRVNERLGSGAPATHRLSVHEVALQVIKGLWGNQPDRQRKLEGAGYNYQQVRAEVNAILR